MVGIISRNGSREVKCIGRMAGDLAKSPCRRVRRKGTVAGDTYYACIDADTFSQGSEAGVLT